MSRDIGNVEAFQRAKIFSSVTQLAADPRPNGEADQGGHRKANGEKRDARGGRAQLRRIAKEDYAGSVASTRVKFESGRNQKATAVETNCKSLFAAALPGGLMQVAAVVVRPSRRMQRRQ
jgi:hypothetical protein